eukprot:GGOE01000513.1.p1 GENE.GGOE01000513.1~~GGOE01000513.1.p1  ORF type:complete len:614 (-),score=122.88 GGOE01000513.1:189-2030(-)
MPASHQSSLSVSEDTDDDRMPRHKRGHETAVQEQDKCEESDVSLSFPASSDDEGGTHRNSTASQPSKCLSEHAPPPRAFETEASATAEPPSPSPRPSSPNLAEATWATDLSLLGGAAPALSGNPLLSLELDAHEHGNGLQQHDAGVGDVPPQRPAEASWTADLSPLGGLRAPLGNQGAVQAQRSALQHDSPAANPAAVPSSSALPSPIYSSPSATVAPTTPLWSPPVPQVPLHHQENVSRRTTPASTSDTPTSPASIILREDGEGEDARVRQLVELLERATQQIRAERVRTKELEQENQSLKQQPRAPVVATPPAPENDPRYLGLQRAYTEAVQRAEKYDSLKQKYRELYLENQMAVEQIAVLRIKCIDMQVALEAEKARTALLVPPVPSDPVPPPPTPSYLLPAAPPAVPATAKGDDPDRDLAFTVVGRNGADMESNRALHPKAGTAQLKATGSAPRLGRPQESVQSHTHTTSTMLLPAASFPSRTPSPVGRSSRSQSPSQRGAPPPRGHSVPSSPKDEVLIHRMIRALSPPPTVSQVGKLVDSMVKELLRNLRARGVDLPLKRIGNCAYTLHERRLNLSVISDKLVVKVGGGHQDLLEHLHRAKCFRPRPR